MQLIFPDLQAPAKRPRHGLDDGLGSLFVGGQFPEHRASQSLLIDVIGLPDSVRYGVERDQPAVRAV